MVYFLRSIYLIATLAFTYANAEDVYFQPPIESRNALVDLYNSTNGAGWANKSNWLSDDVCSWHGISCSSTLIFEDGTYREYQYSIYRVSLSYNSLSGSIPTSLGNLSSLQTLEITGNSLNGGIPYQLGNLSQLRTLSLSYNSLSGEIPTQIGNLSQLNKLELDSNNLSGSLPDSIWNLIQLTRLSLEQNSFTGNLSESIGNLTQLNFLDVSSNSFSGNMPSTLGNLLQLTYLRLGDNSLSGSIPDSIGNLQQLIHLDIGHNSLTGNIPDSIGNLSQLRELNVSNNLLSGKIPDSVGNLEQISQLYLNKNSLSEGIPESITNLTKLTFFDASFNNLSGDLSEALYKWMDTYSLLPHLRENEMLGGPIPQDTVNAYPNFASILATSPWYNSSQLGDLSCYPETDAFKLEFSDTNWVNRICSTESAYCNVQNTGPDCLSGNPINIRNGVKIQSISDFMSEKSPLALTRTYNSNIRKWIFGDIAKSLIIHNPTNRVEVKLSGRENNNYFFYCLNIPAECEQKYLVNQSAVYNGYKFEKLSSGYKYILPSGVVEVYGDSGQLLSITNSRGESLSYSYNTSNIIITDDFGQTINLTVNPDKHNRVEQAVTPIGVFSYNYDDFGRLTTVTKPDTSTLEYRYDEPNYSTVQYYDSSEQVCSGDDYLLIDTCKTLVKNLGLLTSKIDENSQRVSSWYYDIRQRAYKSEHGSGINTTEIKFISEQGETGLDELGNPIILQRVRETISPLGLRTLTTFRSPFGQRVEKIEYFNSSNSLVGTEQYNYDSNGYVSEHIDVNSIVTQYTHDDKGREISRTEKFGSSTPRTVTTSYFGNTNKPTVIVAPESRIDISYIVHNSGLLISQRKTTDIASGQARTTSFGYNASGLLTTINGPRNDVSDITTFEYNSQGLRIKSINALGHEVSATAFNAHGQPTTIIDENNVTITISYDAMGRVLNYERAGLTTSFTYDLNGLVSLSMLSDGTTIEYEYDSANRLVAIVDNIGNRIEYTLDNAGNNLKTEFKDPVGVLRFRQQKVFDEFGRITQFIDGNTNTITNHYLPDGQLDKTIDALNHSKDYAYNNLAQLTTVTSENNGVTSFSYDNSGRTSAVIDAEGKMTSYTYNGFGELIEEVNPNTGTITYTYDEAGNIIEKRQVGEGETRTSTYQYDALNRVISDSAQSVTYSYDDTASGNMGVGKLTSITDEGGTTQNTYNSHGNITNEVRLINGLTFVTSYQYDNLGRLTGMIYPTGRAIDYTLDSEAQISAISMTIEGVTTTLASNIQYLPFGPITSYTYGNGLIKSMAFNDNYQMSSTTTTSVENLSYTYTVRNNIDTIIDALDSSVDQSFSYSPISALTSATGNYGNLSFSYDLVLNRLSYSIDGNTDTYSYETNTHLLESINGNSTTNFTYNTLGDVTQKDALIFTYNNSGQLSSVDNGELTNYQYDYQGRRISKSSTARTTYYLYDQDGLLIAESDSNGNITAEYIYLNKQLLSTIATTVSAPVQDEVIVDNGEPNTSSTGSWSLQKDRKNKAYGVDFMLASGGSGSTYTWQPNLLGGTYEVYAFWVNNRKYSKSALYVINSAGTTNIVNVDQTTNGTQWNLLGTYEFIGDGSEYVQLSDSDGKVVADAVKFIRIDSGQDAESVVAFVHNNHLGAPAHITDSVGNILWEANYTPFGKATVNNDVDGDSKTIDMNVRLPGQYYDAESGLHYNWHRYYDSMIGRYITADPIGILRDYSDPQLQVAIKMGLVEPKAWDRTLNPLYSYVDQNPINFIDPNGLDSLRAALMQAIARGNTRQIRNLMDAISDPKLKKLAQDAFNKFSSRADDWISKHCKGSINREFPDHLRNKTLEEIRRGTGADYKKAWKLLNDSRFQK